MLLAKWHRHRSSDLAAKAFLPRRVPLTGCGSFQWLLLVLIPPWRATISPTISDALGSGRSVCFLRIFVREKASPNYFQILLCSSPKVFLKCWGCTASGVVLSRWKGALFKFFQLFDCYEMGRQRMHLLHGTRAPSAFYSICSRGFPGKCSASISVCKEILLSGQSNK